MMVMWSNHTGADDPDGIGVVEYMMAAEVKKPRPEGGREWIQRIPPPEVLKGDEALMRQAIRAVPFQCRYSSGVLSFEQGDMDVSAFNAGAPELRRQVDDRADRQLDLALGANDHAVGRLDQSMQRLGAAARPGVTRVLRQRKGQTQEIERFKAEIDLCAVAATLGFAEDRKAGDRNHRVMRHQDGTKLIVGASKGGHWVYSSNCGKTGTVVDLLGWRAGLNLGEIRKHLRPWIGEEAGRPKVDIQNYTPQPKPAPTPGDAMKAIAEWESANETVRSIFLERSRGLDPSTLASDRFAETFRVDGRQNAVFPYRDGSGSIVGTERRNRPSAGLEKSFKSYTAGAAPGIWTSNGSPADAWLVIVESPIDAMSHWQMLTPQDQAITRYAAIRAGFRDEDLEALILAMPEGAEIVTACDRDPAGDEYTSKIQAATERLGRAFRNDRPSEGDWNARLLSKNEYYVSQLALPQDISNKPNRIS